MMRSFQPAARISFEYSLFTTVEAGSIVNPMTFVHATIFALIALLLPSDALAWGPGMHVDIAVSMIGKMMLMAPFIRELVKRFPNAFIYGAASPDIIVGKKYSGYIHHCHNWRVGWFILHEAASDRQRSAAYGYLTHLAADIVAHNYYIPVKIVRSYRARLLTHTYWEMRFDLGVTDQAWERLKMVGKEEAEEFDKLLERVLKTVVPFSTSKRIFDTIIILQKMRSLRASLRLYASRSRFDIADENRQHYLALTMEAALDFLKNPQDSMCMQVDPAGLSRLAYAKNLRRRMRAMLKKKSMTVAQADRLVDLVKERLAVAIYRPGMALPDVTDVV